MSQQAHKWVQASYVSCGISPTPSCFDNWLAEKLISKDKNNVCLNRLTYPKRICHQQIFICLKNKFNQTQKTDLDVKHTKHNN
jgi:hypothetical protein